MPTVETNGIETYYERRGTGPPVVFVHGAIVDRRQWAPQFEALSDGYTTVAYDVRGHGRTGGSDRERYTIDLLAEDLHALVGALGLDRPVLCGLSMGGCIAQVYAARYPDDLSGLVLAGTFGPTPMSRTERLQRSVVLPATIPFVRLFGYPRVEKVLVWVQELLSGEGVSGEYERVERLRETGPLMTSDEFAKVIRGLAGFADTEIDDAAIAVPTLVWYGEHEPAALRRHAAAFRARIPQTTVLSVPDAGHASNLDNPAFVTDALREFLAGLDPSPASVSERA